MGEKLQPPKSLAFDSVAAHVASPRNVPGSAEHEAIADVVVGIALVQVGIVRIQVAQPVAAGVPVREGRRQVVNGMRPGVVRVQVQPLVEEIVALELHVQAVVAVEAVRRRDS